MPGCATRLAGAALPDRGAPLDAADRRIGRFFGLRLGFARAPGQSLFPLGGNVGVDLYKTDRVLLGVEIRAYAMLGRKQGPDFALEPAFGANVAY